MQRGLPPSFSDAATPKHKRNTRNAARQSSSEKLFWIMVVAAGALEPRVLTYALIDVEINLDVIVLGITHEACARTRVLHL